MEPELHPVLIPSVNWQGFATAARDATGESPARSVDACKRPLSDWAKFLVILASFRDPNQTDALKNLRTSQSLLSSLFFGFRLYADADTVSRIREYTTLTVVAAPTLDGERVCFVSGTLKEWHLATTECCQPHQARGLRQVFTKAMAYFDTLGLAEIWSEYRRKPLPDNTFYLEYKP